MDIHKLPEKIQKLIGGSCNVNDATQCLMELVFNAIDAKATSIAVRLNLKSFFIQVVDNGCGIEWDNLKIVGERYTTSKCVNMEDLEMLLPSYGYRGTAISSILEISGKIEIQTKPFNHGETYKKVMKQGCEVELSVCEKNRPSFGTTVTITDFLYNIPVRRKRTKEVFDLDDIKQLLEAIVIIHPHISFSLRNDDSGKVLLQTHKQQEGITLIEMFCSANECSKSLLVDLNYTKGSYFVEGFISKAFHTDSTLQLLYVNNRFIHKCRIHTMICDTMVRYGKGWFRDELTDPDPDCLVYVVKIRCPYIVCQFLRNGKKNVVDFQDLKTVLKAVYYAIKSVVKQSGVTHDFASSSGGDNKKLNELCLSKSVSNGNKDVVAACQLTNAVRGKEISRKRKISSEINFISMENYKKKFLDNQSLEGTGMAVNAPIFEMKDFQQVSFYEFLAWLHVKAERDAMADKLLKEFLKFKSSQPSTNLQVMSSVPPNKPQKILSIREIRKEKYKLLHRLSSKKERNKENFLPNKPSNKYRAIMPTPTLPSASSWKSHYQEHEKPPNDPLPFVSPFFKKTVPQQETILPNLEIDHVNGFVERGKNENQSLSGKLIPQCSTRLKKNLERSNPLKEFRQLINLKNQENLVSKPPPYIEEFGFVSPSNNLKTVPDRSIDNVPPNQPQFIVPMDIPVFNRHTVSLDCPHVQLEPSPKSLPAFKNASIQAVLTPKPLRNIFTQTYACKVDLRNVETQTSIESYQDVAIQTDALDDFENSETYKNFLQQIGQVASCSQSRKSLDKQSSLMDTVPANPSTNESCLEVEWTEVNRNSEPFFINSATGFAMFNPPISSTLKFDLKERELLRVQSLPESTGDSLTDILKIPEDITENVKWTDSSGEILKPAITKSVLEEMKDRTEENMKHFQPPLQSSALTKPLAAVHKFLSPFKLTSEHLLHCKVVGQLDRKFILATIVFNRASGKSRILYLFDQHAVHERILLETLLKDYKKDEKFVYVNLTESIEIALDSLGVNLISDFKDHFLNNGLELEIVNSEQILLKSVPACFLRDSMKEECEKTSSVIKQLSMELITEILDHLKETRGSFLNNPRTIINTISSQACRGAIKFNQKLSVDEMTDLIEKLKSCSLPFQCAHGRPTSVPLLNLDEC